MIPGENLQELSRTVAHSMATCHILSWFAGKVSNAVEDGTSSRRILLPTPLFYLIGQARQG